MSRFLQSLRGVYSSERTVCRLIASWCCYIVTTLGNKDAFTRIEWMQWTELTEVALISFLFFLLFSVVAIIINAINTDALFLLFASTVCVSYWCVFAPVTGKEWFLLSAILVYALFVIYCARALENVWSYVTIHKHVAILLVALAGLACFGGIAVMGVMRYKTFGAPNFDFGIWCNMFYNMKQTGLALVTCERDMLLSHFAVHVSPVYYLLLPIYCLFPTPETLQIAQAAVLAAGIIPVYLLARHLKLSNAQTVLVSLLYAFFPAITTGCSYDLHENCFLPLFLLFTFYFCEIRKPIPMYVCAILVLSVKEDAAVYLLFFALFLLVSEKKYLHGTILAAMAIGYFLLCGYLLETTGTGMMDNRYSNLIYNPDDGLVGAVKTILVNPGYVLTQLLADKDVKWDKVMYLVYMLLPLGTLPFVTKKPSRWILVAPMLINLLTMYPYQPRIGFQYHFGIAAFLIYAMLKNLPEIESPNVRRTLLSVACAACLCTYLVTAWPAVSSHATLWQESKEEYLAMETFLDETIPADASVAASTYLVPHLADRNEIFEVHYHKNKPDIEYVVLDARYTSHEKFLQAYLKHGYTLVAELEGRILVLQQASE